MLDINYLRNNTDEAKSRLKKRNREPVLINNVLQLDEDRRKTQVSLDNALAEMNSTSKEIGKLIAQGKKEDAELAKSKTAELKELIATFQTQHDTIAESIRELLITIPNLPQTIVPEGKDAEDNIVVRQGGNVPVFNENPLPHWELAAKYNIIDFELGNKLTGAGFPVYIGKGAKLQRALIAFFLDKGEKSGYTEIMPPLMVNEDSGYGTGQLPDKEGQMYFMPADKYYMIPTAEVPLTNIYRDVILKEEDLPIKLTAYTPCFRREAGSYGKDVKGLNRLHQFDKVEIVHLEHPDRSSATLDVMVDYVESIVQALQLPYRILRLCGGDMGFASAITYDFEVYSAAQERWLEVSSVSNFESFQANRMRCRYKDSKSGKNQLVHTLNGSALALPRILAALLENNQDAHGINIPKALIPFTGFDRIS
ncbi:MAG: serine--tRNA ligase [Bacteroidetes bacterium]|nr:serine--tRNA ligase [Bacteroidota bacterium]MBP7398611.1 serine--tRNA ligase [Chitinophagales bacterium]MBK7108258.1 serine--tRNA ligase [Bacteroidota bacterium]MBK8683100.1 serine--tRNA ligase [Bacteroidota bacterium]MBP9189042.1 serine--tRNA ligase [Chitinophagales bacterium]